MDICFRVSIYLPVFKSDNLTVLSLLVDIIIFGSNSSGILKNLIASLCIGILYFKYIFKPFS